MDFQKNEKSPQTILRLTEVLQRTGLSRSTIYKRIEKREFPHQISLGARSVGWLKGEVEDWITQRIQLRPGPSVEMSETPPEQSISERLQTRTLKAHHPSEATACGISVNGNPPDPADFNLVNTTLYFDRATGAFWLRLFPEPVSGGEKRSKHPNS